MLEPEPINSDKALQYLNNEGLKIFAFDYVPDLEYQIVFLNWEERLFPHSYIFRVKYETVSKMDASFLAPLHQPGGIKMLKDRPFLREFILASKNIVQTEGVN